MIASIKQNVEKKIERERSFLTSERVECEWLAKLQLWPSSIAKPSCSPAFIQIVFLFPSWENFNSNKRKGSTRSLLVAGGVKVSMASLCRTVSLGSGAKVKKKKWILFTLQFPPFSPKATVGTPFSLSVSPKWVLDRILFEARISISLSISLSISFYPHLLSLSLWPLETE